MRTILALLLVLSSLAGCLGDADSEEPLPDPNTGESAPEPESLVRHVATTTATEVLTYTDSGSFTTETYIDSMPCASRCQRDHYILSDMVPPHTAYEFEVVANKTQAGPGPYYSFHLELLYDEGVRHDPGWQYDPGIGQVSLRATMLATGANDVILEVRGGGSADNSNLDYDLWITFTPLTEEIPEFGAASVWVPKGAQLIVETVQIPDSVDVFDGQDQRLGTFDAVRDDPDETRDSGYATVVENETIGQEYVVVAHTQKTRLHVVQPDSEPAPVLRHLSFVKKITEVESIDQGGDVIRTATIPNNPLQIGYTVGKYVPNGRTNVEAQWTTIDSTSTLTNPQGQEVASGNITCELCATSFHVQSELMQSHLVPGEYTLNWSSMESDGVPIAFWSMHYLRASVAESGGQDGP